MEASELKEILEQHQLWIDGKGGSCADLRGASLTGANLNHASLNRANLEGANLTGANLRGADLRGADLTRADLGGANLYCANLYCANLYCANLSGAYLGGANLTNTILPDISWIIPGCLVQLNNILYGFSLEKEGKWDNFIQDSIGFFIQNNPEEGTFDMLLGDRIIRDIPDWVKYSGMSKIKD